MTGSTTWRGDSTKSDKKMRNQLNAVDELTPASKRSGKKSAETVDLINIEKELTKGSTTKAVKLKSVKVEKK